MLGAVAATAALEATYYLGGVDGVPDDTPLRAALVALAGAALTAALLWRWCRNVYARGDAGAIGARSVWLGGLAVLSLLGFWIGLFGPAAAAAAVFGRAAIGAGRRRAGGRDRGRRPRRRGRGGRLRAGRVLTTVRLVREATDRFGDALLAGLSAALFPVQILTGARSRASAAPSLAVALAFSATLALRRRMPLVPLVAGVVLIELSNAAFPRLGDAGIFIVGYLFAIYAAARYADGRATVAARWSSWRAIPLAAIEPGQPVSVSDIAFFAMFFGGPFVAGRVIGAAASRARAARATVAEPSATTQAREAVAEERARIARELHDVVAHAISVMVLQARGGAQACSTTTPDAAREALDAIEHDRRAGARPRCAGCSALLRDGRRASWRSRRSRASTRLDDAASSRLRARGAAGRGRASRASRAPLPPGVDLSAYRIVQEALTNALKHAGPARARVYRRATRRDELELEVARRRRRARGRRRRRAATAWSGCASGSRSTAASSTPGRAPRGRLRACARGCRSARRR